MDKQQRYEDRYIPKIKKVDPDAELYLKEKFGAARLRVESKNKPSIAFNALENGVELESSKLCENCGSPEKLRGNGETLAGVCGGIFISNFWKNFYCEMVPAFDRKRHIDGAIITTGGGRI